MKLVASIPLLVVACLSAGTGGCDHRPGGASDGGVRSAGAEAGSDGATRPASRPAGADDLRSRASSERFVQAAGRGDVAEVEAYLGRGGDPNARAGRLKRTALHAAAVGYHPKVVRLLLEKGNANANTADVHGYAPLHLVAAGGGTELHLAGPRGRKEQLAMAALLLAHPGTDVNADSGGTTPLHVAVRSGRIEVVKLLLSAKASVDVKEALGGTPLHDAREPGIMRLLLDHGADVHAKGNATKFSPLEWARLEVVSLHDRSRLTLDLSKREQIRQELTPAEERLRILEEHAGRKARPTSLPTPALAGPR